LGILIVTLSAKSEREETENRDLKRRVQKTEEKITEIMKMLKDARAVKN
jgi:hypothetical protein